MIANFDTWTRGRSVSSLGTNFGATSLPFQDWRNFKEAFAPELIARALRESTVPVTHCIDPFGGSGTTALACQFLDVEPTAIEVNPFLADLIRAKLFSYDTREVIRDFARVSAQLKGRSPSPKNIFRNSPATFLEPGLNERWVFDRAVAGRIARLLLAIDSLTNVAHKRLFRVLLGGVLVEVSNVLVSGKGRRYRRNWRERAVDPSSVDFLFQSAAESAIEDLRRFARRPCATSNVVCGDARRALASIPRCELSVLSPPYPNSFDYTDVYNIELWTLGYLTGKASNQELRRSTVSSHVQVSRKFDAPPSSSAMLRRTVAKLRDARNELWNQWIPEMIGSYFADINLALRLLSEATVPNGSSWIVVGESKYVDVTIRTAEIIGELAPAFDWRVDRIEKARAMRSSAQQGGSLELGEHLIVLRKNHQ